MKIVFAGTPDFAAIQLKAVVNAGYNVQLVLTQPDRPKGRGQKLLPSAVKIQANQLGILVQQPSTLKNENIKETLKALAPDLIIVCAYGLMVPQWMLDMPRYGCWNVHASLLPRWRGAAPIHYAIWKGDKMTGVSLMQLEAGLDSGPVLLEESIPITSKDTTGSLLEKLTALGAQLLLQGLSEIGHLTSVIQDSKFVTLSPKIEKHQAKLDWHASTQTIERMIRAFDPTPGCYTFYQGKRIKIWEARILKNSPSTQAPGIIQHVSPNGIDINASDGLLRITTLQLPGKPRQTVAQILNAKPNWFIIGESF